MKLNECIYHSKRPCVFKNILTASEKSNEALSWTQNSLASLLQDEVLVFRIGKKSTGIHL
jgi:hypothetical protein